VVDEAVITSFALLASQHRTAPLHTELIRCRGFGLREVLIYENAVTYSRLRRMSKTLDRIDELLSLIGLFQVNQQRLNFV
jgi:hypothetical protein